MDASAGLRPRVALMKIVVIAAAPAVAALLLWAILDLENFVLFAVLGTIVFPASLAKPLAPTSTRQTSCSLSR